ncbi:MAG: NADP-dependent oxidoreductase, partial [Sphingobacteriales bacterium]
ADEILVRIRACAFNPIDFQMRRGLGESKLLTSHILGREFAGIVEDAGNSSFNIGDAVYAYAGSLGSNGTYATHIALPKALVAPIPVGFDFSQAASIPMVSLTALQCFERLMVKQEDSVFVAGGAGGVGKVLIALLKKSGVTKIVTTAGNKESRNKLMDLGLPEDDILDYRSPQLSGRLMDSNGGKYFDYAVDIVGGSMSEICSAVLKTFGVYADLAALTTEDCRNQLFDKAATVCNIANYAMAASGTQAGLSYYGEKLAYISTLLRERKIAPPEVISMGEFSAATVARAHQILEENAARGHKLVMSLPD